MNTPTAAASLRFGRFELQPHERRLLVEGQPAPLGARALDLLHVLVERAGQLVGKNALMELVWPDVVVEDNNLAAQISALRKVLGGDVIATVPGRGYRFTARLDSAVPGQPASPTLLTDAARTESEHGLADVPLRVAIGMVPRTHLPTELTALLGRADDEAVLGNLIDSHRLVSIVGAGGMGKTLLAQHLLDARRGAYAHGVCWVELAQVSDTAALPGVIAAALGVQTGGGEALPALVNAVQPLSLLLALDNAEHLVADVARVCQALHDAAPGLRLLVTSQAALNVAAERVYRIGPLAVPEGQLPARQALAFGAVALFVERAKAADARFALIDANAPTVIELCRALDGLALAIELAAARTPMLGVQRLASSMRDRLKLLNTNRNRMAPARQQTLRAALEWSHGLLDEREQVVFRRLAVMAGSASLALIQQVVADPPGEGTLDEWTVLDALGELVDRSLVAVLNTDTGAFALDTPRYRLLDSARAYALERLDAAGEKPALRRRHAVAVAAQFDAAWAEHFDGSIGDDDWQHKMSFDLDNAREALDFAEAAGDAAVALAIAPTLLRALPKSMPAVYMAVAARCEAMLAWPASLRLRQRAAVQVVVLSGNSGRQRGYNAAQRALNLARELQAEAPDRFMLYLALCRFSGSAANFGDMVGAAATEAELLALEDPAWPSQRLFYGVNTVGCNASIRGDVEAGLRHARRAVALEHTRGARFSVSHSNLVGAELEAGNAAEAARLGWNLVRGLESTRDESELNYARLGLLAALLALDDCEQARPVARAGWQHAARFWNRSAFADQLALLAALEGRPQSAAKLVGFADASYTALDEVRQGTELAFSDRTRTLAAAALGTAEFERLRVEGTLLGDADVAGLAFADPGP